MKVLLAVKGDHLLGKTKTDLKVLKVRKALTSLGDQLNKDWDKVIAYL